MKVFASCGLENSFFLPRSQLALSCHAPVAARRCWLQIATRMSRRHRARGTAAAAATDGAAAAPASRTRGAAVAAAPVSPSADVPDWVGPPGSSVADTRDSPALISNRELEASLCRAKCGRCDEPDCPGARDPAGKGHGCTEFSRSRGDLAWLRGDHADARQPSAAQLAVLRRPAVSLVVTGEIEKISGENLLCYYRGSRGWAASALAASRGPCRHSESRWRRTSPPASRMRRWSELVMTRWRLTSTSNATAALVRTWRRRLRAAALPWRGRGAVEESNWHLQL